MNEENATSKSLRVDLETTLTKCFFKQYTLRIQNYFLNADGKRHSIQTITKRKLVQLSRFQNEALQEIKRDYEFLKKGQSTRNT